MDYNEKMANAIRAARVSAGYTQAQVAAFLNMSQTGVAAWETGRATPPAATIAELAKLYGVSADYLLGLSDYYSDTHKEVIKTLFGDDQAPVFAEEITNLISRLSALSKKTDDTDDQDTIVSTATTCITETIKEFNKLVLSFLNSYQAVELGCLASKLNRSVDKLSERSYAAFPQDVKDLFTETSEFEKTIKAYNPATFSGDALDSIKRIGGNWGILALLLQHKLNSIYKDFDPDKQD